MDCSTWLEAISARLDGEAAVDELVALDAHLTTCPECRDLLTRLELQHRRFRLHAAPVVTDLVAGALRAFAPEPAGGAQAPPPAVVPAPIDSGTTTGQRWMVRALGVAAAAAILLVTISLAGAFSGSRSPTHATPVIATAFARAAGAGESTVVYLSVGNDGASDVVVSASSPVASKTEFHRAIGHAGEAVMQLVTTVALPSGSPASFESSKVHVMLEGLHRDLNPGDVVPIQLKFGHSGTLTVQATVEA